MRALILALLLTGCSPWYLHKETRPNSIVIHSVPNIAEMCAWKGLGLAGCTFNVNESNTAHVYISRDLPQDMWACTLAHEAYHAAGYRHNGNVWECE